MAIKSAYVDNQGRKITATAYQAQKDAGQDVSGYKPIQAQPVEATPTTATPVGQANLTDQMALEKKQNIAGVVDASTKQENISNTPENTIKGSQKNDVISTPTEVKTNKVETTKETGPSKEDTSAQRLAEIQTNLQNYANNPDFQQYFKTQDAFNNYFGREQRTPEQQKVLDSFYTGYKATQDKMAKDNARYLTLSTMSDTDLQNVNDINDISLISLDPNLKARYDAAQKNKQIMEFVYGKDYNKQSNTPDGLDNIAGNYSEEYSKAASELTATKNEMDKIQDTMDSTYDNLVKQYEGTGETDSYIRAKAAKINSELTNQYNDLARKYNTQLGTVTALQATEDKKREEQATNIALANQKLGLFEMLYGSFAERNKATIDPNLTKTIEQKNAKGQTIGYLQWNPATNRYDIPVSNILGGGSGGGTGSGLSSIKSTDSNAAIIKTILASGKFTKDQTKQLIDGINSGGDARVIALNQAKNIMGQTLATQVTKSEQALGQMKEIDRLVSEYYELGGKTNVFKGSYESVINKVGEISDPKLVNIKARIAKALQLYRNSVSGTAYSVQEGQDIASIFPGINKTEGLNRALVDAQISAFESDIDTAYRTTLGGVYDNIKNVGTQTEKPVEVKLPPKTEKSVEALNTLKQSLGGTKTETSNINIGNILTKLANPVQSILKGIFK